MDDDEPCCLAYDDPDYQAVVNELQGSSVEPGNQILAFADRSSEEYKAASRDSNAPHAVTTDRVPVDDYKTVMHRLIDGLRFRGDFTDRHPDTALRKALKESFDQQEDFLPAMIKRESGHDVLSRARADCRSIPHTALAITNIHKTSARVYLETGSEEGRTTWAPPVILTGSAVFFPTYGWQPGTRASESLAEQNSRILSESSVALSNIESNIIGSSEIPRPDLGQALGVQLDEHTYRRVYLQEDVRSAQRDGRDVRFEAKRWDTGQPWWTEKDNTVTLTARYNVFVDNKLIDDRSSPAVSRTSLRVPVQAQVTFDGRNWHEGLGELLPRVLYAGS